MLLLFSEFELRGGVRGQLIVATSSVCWNINDMSVSIDFLRAREHIVRLAVHFAITDLVVLYIFSFYLKLEEKLCRLRYLRNLLT